MKRKYKLHIMARDCPICGGALYQGKSCETCGFSWQAWKCGDSNNSTDQPSRPTSSEIAHAIMEGFNIGLQSKGKPDHA